MESVEADPPLVAWDRLGVKATDELADAIGIDVDKKAEAESEVNVVRSEVGGCVIDEPPKADGESWDSIVVTVYVVTGVC